MCDEMNKSNGSACAVKELRKGGVEFDPTTLFDEECAHSPTSLQDQSADSAETAVPALGTDCATTEQPDVLAHVRAFVRRFVFFRDEAIYDLVAAWIVSTYSTDSFEYVGYLFAYSPEPQSGKSRLLQVLDLLVCNSSSPLVSPTEAVLFRTAHGHTQLLDEVDTWRNREELRSVLNAGFQFGGTVVRMRESGSNYDPIRFPVYCPRALAGIGTRILDATTRDRTFILAMVRQKHDERREQLRVRKLGSEVGSLRKEIANWSTANQGKIKKVYDKSTFPYLDQFRDRTIDITQPLATIIEVAYPDADRLDAAITKLLHAIAITRNEEDSAKDQHRVLRQLEHLAAAEDPLVGSATELAQRCAHLEDPPSVDDISWTLRHYEFATKNVRKGGPPKQRYTLPRAAISEILARYGGEAGGATEDLPSAQQAAYTGATKAVSDDVVGVVGQEALGGNKGESR